MSKKISLVQVQPKIIIDIHVINDKSRINPDESFGHIVFDVVNYSGFKAKNIFIDMKFEESGKYITQWLLADANKILMKDAQKGSLAYKLAPYENGSTFSLEAGEVKKDLPPIGGSVDLSKSCEKDMFVYVRTIWDSNNGYRSDRVHEYKLQCTKSGKGRTYDLIHQKIISQEN